MTHKNTRRYFSDPPSLTYLCCVSFFQISPLPGPIFSYKLRYIVIFWLVEIAISTNPKPTIYRNLYENTDPDKNTQGSTKPVRQSSTLRRWDYLTSFATVCWHIAWLAHECVWRDHYWMDNLLCPLSKANSRLWWFGKIYSNCHYLQI